MIDINIAKEVLMIEQKSIIKTMNSIDNNFESFVYEIFKTKGRVIISGIGKSGYIGMKVAATLSSTGTPSIFIHPSEAFHGDLGVVGVDDVVLLFSYSGETDEVLKLIPFFRENKNKILTITGNPNSTLAENSDKHLLIKIEKEACPFNLAPTASTTTMLAMGDAIAITLMNAKKFTNNDYARFHPGGNLGRILLRKVSDEMELDVEKLFISPDTKLMDALYIISSGKMGLCIVVDNEKSLLGIITDGDIRRIFQKFGSDFHVSVESIMNNNPITFHGDKKIVDAEKLMDERKIHQLIIIDDNNRVLGVLPYRRKIKI